jgi:putative lipoprotein
VADLKAHIARELRRVGQLEQARQQCARRVERALLAQHLDIERQTQRLVRRVAQPPGAPSSFVDITGSVAYLARSALPPDAVLIIRVQDTSRADAPALTLAEQRIGLAGNPPPIPFRLTVDRDLIGKNAQLTVTARIERKGKLLFINDTIHRALSDGKPRHVDMQLKETGVPQPR